ncbi:MAG: 50S ribosomal protein L6 [Candidatus Nealsonbacteria bacterium RBG_13_42_11]|uniref:Large ribosomal subunit protein uL6 n=1 Tax=Candidatus Nealsonbacteria bacterium RBG_13_42_11 TaxID=1801663 RepID=A0A1G2DZG9_9BACT|nr:MAG: 50S ribosomal protein L6 [Candidatus Nealsonbacteria bacterium RBG_13_42_11]
MSRIGKKPIPIPTGVEVKIDGNKIQVLGPKGELSREIRPEIKIEIKEGIISLSLRGEETKENKSLWGLSAAIINNMIKGVTVGFEKKLEIQGVGYKSEVQGDTLVLNVGFSHQVKMKISPQVKIAVEKNTLITVSGTDKELVGQIAANIRKVKPPEPYKGKGIRYLGEVVRKKVGKKVVGTTTGAA